jgi:hypothetical protein
MAAAELAEETGLRAGRLEKLGYLHCANGMSGEGMHVFLATELTAGEPDREQTEQDMQQQWFSQHELVSRNARWFTPASLVFAGHEDD